MKTKGLSLTINIILVITLVFCGLMAYFPRYPVDIMGKPIYLVLFTMMDISAITLILGFYIVKTLNSLTDRIPYYRNLMPYPEARWKITSKNAITGIVIFMMAIIPSYNTVLSIYGWCEIRNTVSQIATKHIKGIFEDKNHKYGTVIEQYKAILEVENKASHFIGSGIYVKFQDPYTFKALIDEKRECLYVYNMDNPKLNCGSLVAKYDVKTNLIIKNLFTLKGSQFEYRDFIKEKW